MKLHKILIFVLLCILYNGCMVFNRSARAAEKAEKVKANYQIGYLENRDFRFDPFRIKNFISLLKFEIIRGGNGLVEDGSESDPSKNSTSAPQQTPSSTVQNPEAKDSVSPPVPTQAMQAMTNPEGVKPNSDATTAAAKDTKRMLTETEIKSLSTKTNFDYYLQGSFGMSDNGSILDRNFTTLIFIDVYDKTGKLIRTVSYAQESKNFSEADDLRQASISLVDKIMKKQENIENKEWWKFGF
ncbi:lipoprotein [Leptospira sp. FAT2]|uniref:lipoprotein n=1 Tax=Leptospira sanjuanensis TaxID=2879643 RepID=UPI001EE8E7B2|nr:lipoprotein [Leptospira sanjuanensis]MCG6167176.1 lipoprotein [Leptospira sanjuanensis]MCG6192635.1 lipoprotein [Leptospira sanjuanensis]